MRRRTRVSTLAPLLASALLLTVLAGCTQAIPVQGVRTTGPLYVAGSNYHFCTASVVNSPQGNLLITAAHCVAGPGAGMTFVPGSVGGSAPYGSWRVTASYADPAWITGQNPQRDVAFLKVAPQPLGGRERTVQQVTSGNHLALAPSGNAAVVVPAYRAGAGGAPISCLATTYRTSGYPTFDCQGYTAGVSGSPWIVGTNVVGVIGGLHQGGCSPDTTYSPLFDSRTVTLYDRAVSASAGDTLPTPGPDGC